MKIISHKIGFHKDIFKPSLLKSTAAFLVFVFAWTNLGIYTENRDSDHFRLYFDNYEEI